MFMKLKDCEYRDLYLNTDNIITICNGVVTVNGKPDHIVLSCNSYERLRDYVQERSE